jgi:hypothetical protein
MAALSVPWMLDADGRVRPEFADSFEVVGRRDRDAARRELDEVEAFANLAPTA